MLLSSPAMVYMVPEVVSSSCWEDLDTHHNGEVLNSREERLQGMLNQGQKSAMQS
jgi:hypothetical protein